MRRILLLAILLVLPACRDGAPEPSPPPATGTSGPTVSATATTQLPTTPPDSPSTPPSPSPTSVKLPADAAGTVEDPAAISAVAAGDLSALAPPGAEIGFREVRTDPFEEIALTWRRGDDAFAQEQGFVVWRPFGQGWTAVYAYTDPPDEGVLGISVERGELTGDEVPEYLTFEQTGGSGACGRWRVITTSEVTATEVFRSDTCDTDVTIVDGALEVREAVFAPEDPHCCPSAFRISTLEWDGLSDFVLVSSEEVPAES